MRRRSRRRRRRRQDVFTFIELSFTSHKHPPPLVTAALNAHTHTHIYNIIRVYTLAHIYILHTYTGPHSFLIPYAPLSWPFLTPVHVFLPFSFTDNVKYCRARHSYNKYIRLRTGATTSVGQSKTTVSPLQRPHDTRLRLRPRRYAPYINT